MVRVLICCLALASTSTAWAGSWGKTSSDSWDKASASTLASTEIAVGKRLAVGAPVVVGELAVYPVLDRDPSVRPTLDAVPLAQAMANGQVRVREVQGGVVAEVALVNRGEDAVFAMVGDVIEGGMQDRVVTQPVLVAGGASVRVPVHCVERGRWHGQSGAFAYGGRAEPAIRDVVRRAASQDATWSAVAEVNRTRGVDADDSWLRGAGIDAGEAATLEQALRARFTDDKRVVGIVVARQGRFETPEVYAHPALFARDRAQVLQSHLAGSRPDPVDRLASRDVPSPVDAAAWLERTLLN